MVGLIEKFSGIHCGCPVIVTSRFVGYREAPMSDEFSIYHLSAFNDQEVEKFAQKLIKVIASIKKDEAARRASTFIKQTNNLGKDLRENPLMLGLWFISSFIAVTSLPIVRRFIKNALRLCSNAGIRGVTVIFNIPVDFELLDLFSHLARAEYFGSAELEDGVSRDWLTAAARSFFENWYLDKAKALSAARSLVDFITGRAWVMFEVGPNVYKFTHRTFLEYFFARHLLSSSESIDALIRNKLFPEHFGQITMGCHCTPCLTNAMYFDAADVCWLPTITSIISTSPLAESDQLSFLMFVLVVLIIYFCQRAAIAIYCV